MDWVSDESVSTCRKCHSHFGFLTRKHHCRSCGNIYCYLCLDTAKICEMCKKTVDSYYNLDIIISLLPLSYVDYYQLLFVNKKYHRICKKYINFFYKLLNTQLLNNCSRQEIQLFNNNLQYFSINKYFTAYCKYKEFSTVSTNKSIEHLLINKIIECVGIQPKFFYYLNQCVTKRYESTFFNYVDLIIYWYGFKKIFVDFNKILSIYQNDILLMNHLFWSVLYYSNLSTLEKIYRERYKNLLNLFLNCINKNLYNTYSYFYSFSNNVIKQLIISKDIETFRKYLIDDKCVISTIPISKHIECSNIIVNDIRMLNSQHKPIIIPFQLKNCVFNLLLKKININEFFIMRAIVYLDSLLIENKLNLLISTYDIIPLHHEYGFVEMIPDSVTLFYIKNIKKMSIQNYILEQNKIDYHVFKNNITRSLAGYCILQYFLGIGDRHNENILITSTACIFHVDFEYILGKEPSHIIAKNPIKLTHDMIDCLGGINSNHFKLFLTYCIEAFKLTRKKYLIFYQYFKLLSNISDEYLVNFLKNRFLLDYTESEAVLIFQNCILSNINNLSDTLIDYLHLYVKKSPSINSFWS